MTDETHLLAATVVQTVDHGRGGRRVADFLPPSSKESGRGLLRRGRRGHAGSRLCGFLGRFLAPRDDLAADLVLHQAASVAHAGLAVVCGPALVGLLPLALQELGRDALRNVLPGQNLVRLKGTGELFEAQAAFFDRFLPALELEMLVPGVVPGACPPHPLQHFGHTTVPAGQKCLDLADFRFSPVHLDVRPANSIQKVAQFLADFLRTGLSFPLKGRVSLRHERRNGHVHASLPRVPSADAHHFVHEIDNSLQILFRLRGLADHEVQLYQIPAFAESQIHRAEQILVGVGFVDYVPQPFGARLRRQGQARFSHVSCVGSDFRSERLRPQRRKGEIDHPFPQGHAE